MIRPIPDFLLIHTVEYSEYLGNDGYDETYAPPVTIMKVRVQPVKSGGQPTGESDRERREEMLVLFYDCIKSSPSVNFTQKSKVVFNGNNYTVVRVTPVYALDPSKPHHIEVELI